MPEPPSEKSASICLSHASASCAISQLTREVFSVLGSSAIASLDGFQRHAFTLRQNWMPRKSKRLAAAFRLPDRNPCACLRRFSTDGHHATSDALNKFF
jgi:hypothetical protein